MSLSPEEVTSLFSAIESHDVSRIDAMLEAWAPWDFNIDGELGKSPLIAAVSSQDKATTTYFLSQGADVLRSLDGKHTALSTAISAESHCWPLLLRQLVHDHEVNKLDETGNSALHYALMFGKVDILKDLLAQGANVNLVNKKGQLPLEILAQSSAVTESNKAELYRLLFPSIRFDLYVESDREKLSELLFSLSTADDDIYKHLLMQCDKEILDQKSAQGLSALHIVILNKQPTKARLLLDTVIDIHAISPDGNTALMELFKHDSFPQKHALINYFEEKFSAHPNEVSITLESIRKFILVFNDYHLQEKKMKFRNADMSEERIKSIFLKIFTAYAAHLKSADEVDSIKQDLLKMPLIFSDKKITFGLFTSKKQIDPWQKTALAKTLAGILEDRKQTLQTTAQKSHP